MYLAENKQESYIKPQNYEQTKKNKNKKKKHPYAKYNFEYNEETDTFTCPGGETLTLRGEKKSKSGTGYSQLCPAHRFSKIVHYGIFFHSTIGGPFFYCPFLPELCNFEPTFCILYIYHFFRITPVIHLPQ